MFEQRSFSALKKEELFDQLFNSLEAEFGQEFKAVDDIVFNHWRKEGPLWQRELVALRLSLEDCLGRDQPFLGEIYRDVWNHFEGLPIEESKDVGSAQVMAEFRKVISNRLPDGTREIFLKALEEPLRADDGCFRRVVGL